MEKFYHGTCRLFKEFSLSFLGTGEGKSKFGQGIYVTSSYATAALYAAKAAKANGEDKIYVYTVEVPDIKDDNHIFSCKPVNSAVVEKTERAIGEAVPEEVKSAGKLFRKYIGNLLTDQRGTVKKMMGKADAAAENAASQFLDGIGVDYLVWPQSQTKPDGETNRAVLNEGKIRILKVEQVEVDDKNKLIPGSEKEIALKSFYSISDFIKEHYPQYYGYVSYPREQCATIHKVDGEWGVFCNFASTPIEIDGVVFKSSEHLFQLMKFKEPSVVANIMDGITNNGKKCYQIKKTVKSYEKEYRRSDWGSMVIDAMKFCLVKKYEQSAEFRSKLEASKGLFIVEDQTTMPKKNPDAWGVKPDGGNFSGPNLLGRLLMELRDNGTLEYSLPADALAFIEVLK